MAINITRLFFYILFLSAHSFVYSQLLDTSSVHDYKPTNIQLQQTEKYLFLDTSQTNLDTSLNLFYNYYPTYQNAFPFIDLGLEATPVLALSKSNNEQLKLRLGADHMNPYFYDEKIHIYQTDKPFTRLNYSQGANEMLSIVANHAQQISKRLSFGIDYRRIKNQNFYFSNLENFSRVRMGNLFNTKFYTSYYSPDRKYEMIASYLWNRSRHVESGGLSNDSFFNVQKGRNKINNNLINYTDGIGTLAQNQFRLTQYFRPGGLSTDSTLNASLNQFKEQFFISTALKNERLEFEDNNPDSLNYGVKLTPFKDSSYHRSVENEVGYMKIIGRHSLSSSLMHDYSSIYQNTVTKYFQNLYISAKGIVKLNEFQLEPHVKFGILGYNAGDYQIDGVASYRFKRLNFIGRFLSHKVEPTFMQQEFRSNAIQWENNFSKINVNQLQGSISTRYNNHNLKVDIKAENTNGLIYYHDENKIAQYDDNLTWLRAVISHNFLRDNFGSDLNLTIQQSSNQEVLPRPKAAISGNFYTKFKLFQKNLRVQLGFRSFWFSSFNTPRYNPYTRAWHNTNEQFESTPPIQVYTNAKVKSFCFGIEFFHTQQGLMGEDYYSSPGYPMMPRNLRLNIRWDFNN
tara:strand:+ start:2824 stop:4704 length:1881 start_codon:yes stop_codon:yes gene_type:complete